MKIHQVVTSILIVFLLSSLAGVVLGQMQSVGLTCEQCGMTVDSTSQTHFRIVDSNGTLHYAECMMCALKLLKTYGQLNITTNCDWYGPNYTITVNAKQYGSSVVVSPTSALVIAGGGCSKNRVVYNQTAANMILANNGTSDYLAAIQKYANGINGSFVTVPANATIMTVAEAALQFGGGMPSPSPSASASAIPEPSPTAPLTPTPSATYEPTEKPSTSPTSTQTPYPTSIPDSSSTPISSPASTLVPEATKSPQVTQTETPLQTESPASTTKATPAASATNIIGIKSCEACGMDVTPADQVKYVVTDGNGTVHYAECFMCALNLLNNYYQVKIISYCDWYGSNYTVTVESSQYGKVVTVNPSTAMFLNGGSCVVNRIAYNQTAADALTKYGFSSENTLVEQQYAMPASASVLSVKDAATTFAGNISPPASQTPLLLVIATVLGVVLVAGAFVVFKKIKSP